MDIDQLLTTTRSVRRSFDLGTPVDLDDLQRCLQIGLQAANGSNQQSWRWLVITEPTLRQRLAELYRMAYLDKVGGRLIAELMPDGTAERRLMSSTEWLVQHLAEIPALVIPCYESAMPRADGDESFYQATLYGSIFPAVWNFALALHSLGYGTCITTLHLNREQQARELLGIPDSHVQGCLLPVGKLRPGYRRRPAARRPITEVVAFNGWSM